MTTPVILVDMDGPLAAFDQRVFEVCRSNGWQVDCTWDDGRWKHRFLTEHMDRDDGAALRAHINESRFFADLEPVEGCIDGMHELAEHADVWIATKPLEANVNVRDDKAAWVRRYLGDEFERRLIIASDKSLVKGDVLLDDAIDPKWLDRAEWVPVVFPAPFNRHPESRWADIAQFPFEWTWGDPVDALLDMAGRAVRAA